MGKNYKLLGQLTKDSNTKDRGFLGGNLFCSFEGFAKIKDSVNSKEELGEYFINYWKQRGYKVFCLTIYDNVKEECLSVTPNCYFIDDDDTSFYFSIRVHPIIGDSISSNSEKKDNDIDIFACYKTITEIGKDGVTEITSYKQNQCFKDEISATAFIEDEIKQLVFESVLNTKKKSTYVFNPQDREWSYTEYSTETEDFSVTEIEFTVEYIGKLHF